MTDTVPLVLGGGSLAEPPGLDSEAVEATHRELIRTCVDAGVTAFDTRSERERVALARALDSLGRPGETTVFVREGPGGAGAPGPYERGDAERMADDLGVESLDALVVVPVEDDDAQARQEELAVSWREAGLVGRLGTWHPGPDPAERFGDEDPYEFAVEPYSVSTADAPAAFAAATERGWEAIASSPFDGGRLLGDMVAAAINRAGEDDLGELPARVADHLIRYSLFQPNVDRLLLAMRDPGYVERNVESVERGPLSDEERAWLDSLR
ncbi:MAG: hypothetical protein ABEJ04_02295 [Halobacteriaceae archaeon]